MKNTESDRPENTKIDNIYEIESDRDPLPRDPVSHILLAYFDHRWYHIYAKPREKGKKIKWRTEKRYCIAQRNLWFDWLKEDKIMGLGFGNETKRIVIDLDIKSPYHPNNDDEAYQKILQTLEELGLYGHVVIQSSWSGGIHIYYFLEGYVSSYYASSCIQTALKAAGFEIKNGHLEVFPNTKPYGSKGKYTNYKAHRLPLQPGTGSCILSSYSLEFKGFSLAKFAQMAKRSAMENDLEHFRRMINLCKDSNPEFWENHRKRYKVSEWWTHLNDFIKEGWTDYHQTNIILGKIAQICHVFEKKTGEELEEAMVAIATSLEGYHQFCRHQHEIESRCRDWAKSVQKYNRMLYQRPERQENYQEMLKKTSAENPNKNHQKAQQASNRIKQAYDHIIETMTTLPQKISEWIAKLNETAKKLTGEGISKNTLFKKHNLPLWHPRHQKSKDEVVETPKSAEEKTPNHDQEESNNQGDDTPAHNSSVIKNEDDEQKNGQTTEKAQEIMASIQKEYNMEDSKRTTEKTVIQNERQTEAITEEESVSYPTPSEVVWEKSQKSEKPECISGKQWEQNSYTLPVMKCQPPPESDLGAAPQRQHQPESKNEIKRGYGGENPDTEAEKGGKIGENGQNLSKEADNTVGAEKEPMTAFNIKKMVWDKLSQVASHLSGLEKFRLVGKQLKLCQEAKKMAQSGYLSPTGFSLDEKEIFELWCLMAKLRRSGIPEFQEVVEAWCGWVSDGVLGDMTPPAFW